MDNLTKKIANGKETTILLSVIIGRIVYAVVITLAVVQALTILKIDTISTPALAIINAVFGAIPNLLLAAVIVAVGLLVATVVCNLLGNILIGINLDGLVAKVLPGVKIKFSATKIVVNVVRVLIMLLIVAQGIEVLGLAMLTNIMAAVIAYLPAIFKALLLVAAAYFGANLLESFLVKNMPEAKKIAKILKALIYVLAGFMVLNQLDFATYIVNTAFTLILVAIAVAFAIAFGIGGKDFAKKTLDKVDCDKLKSQDTEEKKDEE